MLGHYLLGLICVFAFVSCGNEVDGPPKLGEFSARLDIIYESKILDSCDAREKEIRYEMAKFLDEKTDSLRDYLSQEDPTKLNNRYTYKKAGPMTLRTPNQPDEGEDKWVTANQTTWSELYAWYQETVKDAPVGKDTLGLSAEIRNLLVNDTYRLIEKANLYLDHTSGPMIQALIDKLEACTPLENKCFYDHLTPDEEAFLKGNPLYRWFYETHERADILLSDLRYDARRYNFEKYDLIRRDENGYFFVPVNAGQLSEIKGEIEAILTKYWVHPHYQLKIEWVEGTSEDGVFNFLFDPLPYERAYVNIPKKIIQLYDFIKEKSIAHEFGHVLGFNDYYYTIYQSEACRYHEEYNPGDLMANSLTGRVLPQHWDMLDQKYPAPVKEELDKVAQDL